MEGQPPHMIGRLAQLAAVPGVKSPGVLGTLPYGPDTTTIATPQARYAETMQLHRKVQDAYVQDRG